MALMVDEILLAELQGQNLQYYLELDKKSYPLSNVSIAKSVTPLTKPNIRGGVYFSDTSSYRIKGSTQDRSIIPLLSNTMLGPNTEFRDLKITAKSDKAKYMILANLTNTMQNSSRVELNMVIVDVKN